MVYLVTLHINFTLYIAFITVNVMCYLKWPVYTCGNCNADWKNTHFCFGYVEIIHPSIFQVILLVRVTGMGHIYTQYTRTQYGQFSDATLHIFRQWKETCAV